MIPEYQSEAEGNDSKRTGLSWRKSSYSMGNGDCLEFAHLPTGGAAVRDSKDRSGPILLFGENAWQAYIDGIKSGESGRVV